MTEPIDVRERRELCDLIGELGPDAPTLCEGWTTLDLSAHLVLREHFKRWKPEQLAAEKAKGLPHLLTRLRAGAPLVPWRIPRLRTLLNGGEYFIHHEDVRRANGLRPRPEQPDLEALAWRMVGFTGRRTARSIRPYGLTIRRLDGTSRQFGPTGGVTVSGRPTELLLYLSGRRDTAQVSLDGAADAIAALRNADAGF